MINEYKKRENILVNAAFYNDDVSYLLKRWSTHWGLRVLQMLASKSETELFWQQMSKIWTPFSLFLVCEMHLDIICI